MEAASPESKPSTEDMAPAAASLGFEEFGVEPTRAAPEHFQSPTAIVGSIYESAPPVALSPPAFEFPVSAQPAAPPASPAAATFSPAAAVPAPAVAATPPPAAPAAGFDFGLEDALGSDFDLKSGDLKSSDLKSDKDMPAWSPPPAIPAPPVSAKPAAAAPQNIAPPSSTPVPRKEESSALGDIFADFKQEMEIHDQAKEDPETHYSLGIAFKEMGLLDEAIGELQAVCRTIENGTPFNQSVSAYTWLAQCLVEKGAAQAAIPWYEKALQVGGIDQQTKLAINYDLASANEAAGDTVAARKIFMQVYGSNIDYRDVAERLKSLKP